MRRVFQSLPVLLLLAGAVTPASAATTDFRLTPEKLKASAADPLSFTIKVDRLKDGNLLFRVTVTSNGPPFRASAHTCLALEQRDPAGAYSRTTLRDLPADKKATTVTCVFVVPEVAVADPELCFQLQNVEGGSGDVYSVSLKDLVDFYKP
jgi:hypothetical protein